MLENKLNMASVSLFTLQKADLSHCVCVVNHIWLDSGQSPATLKYR